MIKVIVFDLGGVLVEINLNEFLNKLSHEFNISTLEIIKNSSNEAHIDYMKGEITSKQFYNII